MRLTRPTILVCLLLMMVTNAIAQQSMTVRIGGSVSSALKLSLAAAPSLSASASGIESPIQMAAHETGDDQIVIDLRGQTISAETSLAVPIEIRTNVAYELTAMLAASDGCAPSIRSQVVTVGSSGAHVRAGAVEQSIAVRSPALFDGRLTALLGGPRVSRAGNFSTPTNALRVSLVFTLSATPSPCDWHATLRLALRPAAGD